MDEVETLDPDEHVRIVKEGYDTIAEAYCRDRDVFDNCTQIEEFISHLPENGVVLDIGCGGGVPVLQTLVKRGFRVKGIDFSKYMLEIARRNVPSAELILGDVT
jgi:2-polyprenyl-3-methyl-5-hydroxy-6-metoxy-1,4-benzoquinol methylase